MTHKDVKYSYCDMKEDDSQLVSIHISGIYTHTRTHNVHQHTHTEIHINKHTHIYGPPQTHSSHTCTHQNPHTNTHPKRTHTLPGTSIPCPGTSEHATKYRHSAEVALALDFPSAPCSNWELVRRGVGMVWGEVRWRMWCGLMWLVVMWCGVVWYDEFWLDLVWHDMM